MILANIGAVPAKDPLNNPFVMDPIKEPDINTCR